MVLNTCRNSSKASLILKLIQKPLRCLRAVHCELNGYANILSSLPKLNFDSVDAALNTLRIFSIPNPNHPVGFQISYSPRSDPVGPRVQLECYKFSPAGPKVVDCERHRPGLALHIGGR